MRGIVATLLLAGCVPGEWSSVLVYDYVGDGEHVVRPAVVDSLTSLRPMQGELGTVTRGGGFIVRGGDLYWRSGPVVDLPYTVVDGTVVPSDSTGLILTSFYHHLGTIRDELSERGWSDEMDAIFPVRTIAWTPEAFVGEALPVENAAYASNGLNLFLLFEDGNLTVPLGAHSGVVRHEFGHAFFAVLTPGFTEALLDGEAIVEDSRAANEGFADIVAELTLDDVRAIPFDERNPLLDHSSAGYDGDPYALGVVFAAFVWDMRLVTNDPDDALVRSVDALVAWYEGTLAETLPRESLSYAITLYDAFEPVVPQPVLCERFRARFPDVEARCAE